MSILKNKADWWPAYIALFLFTVISFLSLAARWCKSLGYWAPFGIKGFSWTIYVLFLNLYAATAAFALYYTPSALLMHRFKPLKAKHRIFLASALSISILFVCSKTLPADLAPHWIFTRIDTFLSTLSGMSQIK